MTLSGENIVSFAIYFSAFFGTVANLILLLAFISNAIKKKVFQPLDRIIVNMALVNLLLCFYKEIPGLMVFLHTKVFGQVGCRILLYVHHTLRLVSLWSVANLSFLHLIKIRRPYHRWFQFIHRHQRKYVNWSLAGCWVVSITFHTPYFLYSDTGHVHNQSNTLLTSTNCLCPSESSLMKLLTYITVSMDFLLIILVILLNGFIIDLLCRHRRQVRDTMTVRRGWDKRAARATRMLLSLLLIYVICWFSNGLVWIAVVSGVLQSYQNNILIAMHGTLSSIYYSFTSGIMVFGYRQVRDYLSEATCCSCQRRAPPVIQREQQRQ
ncbi:vomeronasal type-1 receptor 90 [Xenopus laevis]|uniref:Vomeronasal type-1 receptor n=1 Tax=Xenopus laevis TaxID=8355 RepID=A0A8J0U6N3_XENLA|nr:vomeronasal type-1 receptor 90 [Xenopus laevis]